MSRIARSSICVIVFVALVPMATAQSLDGFWRSEGYGYVFDVHGSELRTFQITHTTCVLGYTARRVPGQVSGREATFIRPATQNTFFVRRGGSGNHKLLHFEYTTSDVRINRLSKLPEICNKLTTNTPLDNFEVFTRTFAEHYIAFDLKDVDWNAVVAENRQRITNQTAPVDLFNILQSMIKPFGDAHTFLVSSKPKLRFEGIRPGTDRVAKGDLDAFQAKGMREVLGITDRAFIKGPLRKFCNDQIEYGHIDQGTGYLRILSFFNYSKQRGFAPGTKALETALDQIFSDPTLKKLVIDVRINYGGSDAWALDFVSRLATTEYVAYTKYARADAFDRNKWTEGDPSVIQPSSRPSFHGPVVLLTGPLTISGGETFTQALMGRTPKIIRIGENTQGVFSDVLGRILPNGWRFGLPNEVYRAPDGVAFDGVGIAPDITVPVLADGDVAAGRDPGMAKAIEVLRGMQ